MSNKQWDGKFSNLKISEDSNPELYSELAPLNHKGRSERLRFLASLGIIYLRQMRDDHTARQASRTKTSVKSQPRSSGDTLAKPNDQDTPSSEDKDVDTAVLREDKGKDLMRSERKALNSKLLHGLLD